MCPLITRPLRTQRASCSSATKMMLYPALSRPSLTPRRQASFLTHLPLPTGVLTIAFLIEICKLKPDTTKRTRQQGVGLSGEREGSWPSFPVHSASGQGWVSCWPAGLTGPLKQVATGDTFPASRYTVLLTFQNALFFLPFLV